MESHYIYDNTMTQPTMNQPHSPNNPYSVNHGGYEQHSSYHTPQTTSYNEISSNVVSPNPYGPSHTGTSHSHDSAQNYRGNDPFAYPDLAETSRSQGQYGHSDPALASRSGYPRQQPRNSVGEFKSFKDMTRERGANARALALLETSVNPEKYLPASRPAITRNMTKKAHARQVRQEAIQRYYGKHSGDIDQGSHQRPVQKVPERLAESSRQVKNHRRGYDPHLAGDKCQLDLERQKFAEKRALQMLNNGFIN